MTQGVAIEQLLMDWTPEHRLVWVGDASMASYELFNSYHRNSLSGLGWLQRIRRACPASVWLNPDPQQYWEHPTVLSHRFSLSHVPTDIRWASWCGEAPQERPYRLGIALQ